MGLETGPAGAQGFPGPRGKGDKGDKGDSGNSGITLTDNLDGSFTIATVNPPQSITFFNGAPGNTPTLGVDYFDGATGNLVSFVFGQVLSGSSAPTITAGTGSYDGSIETPPTGSVTWYDDPVFTAGYDTYVSKNEYVHDNVNNTWSLKNNSWSSPVIYTRDVPVQQTRLVSYVFRRSASSLSGSPPTGGSFLTPVPDGVLWSDGIPAGSDPVYFSKRIFTSDGLSPQEVVWSDPILLLNNGLNTKFQFGPTITGPWNDIPNTTDEWMVVCTQQLDGTYVCDTLNPIKIKGEAGTAPQVLVRSFAFKRATLGQDLSLETPTGGTYASPYPVDGLVTGWTREMPQGSGDLYITDRLFTSNGLSPEEPTWATPTLFSGEGAIQLRVEQSAYVWKFDKDGLNPYPNDITFTAFRQNISDLVTWEVYEDDDVTVITTVATKTNTDTFTVTASEFGANNQIRVVATAGIYTDTVYIQRIQDGIQGPAGAATEIREVRFQYSPDNAAWHDAPILVTDKYIREATFYDNVIQGTWSTGVKFVGDDGLGTYTEFWFSNTGTGNPDTNAAEWDRTQDANDFYIIAQTYINAVAQGWNTVTYIRGDDGIDGKYFETQWALSDKDIQPQIDLTTPVAPDYDNTVANPPGWTTDLGSLTPTGTQIIWAISSTKLFSGALDVNWTAAQKWGAYTPVKGNDFTDGLGGVYVSRVYTESTAQPTPPSGGSYTAAGGETGVNFTVDDPDDPGVATIDWVDDPFSPSAGKYIWVTQQVYTPTINGAGENVWAITTSFATTGSSRYAYIPTFGVDYTDGAPGGTGPSGKGTFTSYVFRNAATRPAAPTGGSYNGTTETVPTNWADDPTQPADDSITIWISKRVYKKDEGSTTWDVEVDWTDPPVEFSGSPPFTGYLTNASSVVSADAAGSGYVLTGTNGVFECFFGDKDVTTECTFAISGQTSFDATYSYFTTASNLDLRLNDSTGAYDFGNTGADWNSDQESFVLTATHPNTSTVVTQKLFIAKSKQGIEGPTGVNSRLDIAYADDAIGGNVAYPSGRIADLDYTAATRGTRSWIGTNVVTWLGDGATNEPEANPADNALGTPDADDYTAYEWTLVEASNGLSSRIDTAYASNVNPNPPIVVGDVSNFSTTPLASSKWFGTNVVSWEAGTTEPALGTATDYEWTYYEGPTGPNGDNFRTDTVYATDITTNPPTLAGHVISLTTEQVEASQWIGTREVTWTPPASAPTVSTNGLLYTWSQFRTNTVVATPTNPTGVVRTAGIQSIHISWTAPTYSGHSHTNIYRGTNTTYKAKTAGDFYVDTTVSSNAAYSYWLEHENINGTKSSKVAVASITTGLSYDEATNWVTNAMLSTAANELASRIDYIDTTNGGLISRTTNIENDYVIANDLTAYVTNTTFNAVEQRVTVTEGYAQYQLKVESNGNVAGFNINTGSLDNTTTMVFAANQVLFNSDKFAINTATNTSDPGDPNVIVPFVVESNQVYMDNVYVRGTLEAHRIINVDVAGVEASATLNNTVIEGDLSVQGILDLPIGSITENMLGNFKDDYLKVTQGSPTGGSGEGVIQDAAIVNGATQDIVTIVSAGNQLTFSYSVMTAVLGVFSVPTITFIIERKTSAQTWTSGVTVKTVSLIGSIKSGVTSLEDFSTPLEILTSTSAGTYDYRIRITAKGGTWATNAQVRATISESFGAGSITISTPVNISGNTAVTGALTATGNITAYFSDERLKDIIERPTNCLEAVNSWDVIRYTPNQLAVDLSKGVYDSTVEEIGLTAQSVYVTHPELVSPAPVDNNYLTINYDRTTAVLTGAIQELSTEIEYLKSVLRDNGLLP